MKWLASGKNVEVLTGSSGHVLLETFLAALAHRILGAEQRQERFVEAPELLPCHAVGRHAGVVAPHGDQHREAFEHRGAVGHQCRGALRQVGAVGRPLGQQGQHIGKEPSIHRCVEILHVFEQTEHGADGDAGALTDLLRRRLQVSFALLLFNGRLAIPSRS